MQRKNLEIMALATVAIAVCALASFAVFGGDDHDPTATDPDYLPNPITDDLRDYPDAEEVQAEMDELFAALNIATLADLQTAMKRVAVGPNAYKNLNAWLDSFVSFVLANPNRWFLLYNYHLRGGHLSAEYRQQIISLTQMWQKSFDAVYAHLNARKRRLARQVLWLSLFALSSFLTTKVIDNLSMVNKKNLCKLLLNTYLAGIAVLKKG